MAWMRRRMRQRRQPGIGLIPWLWKKISGFVVWVWRHPQPVLIPLVVSAIAWGMCDFTQRSDAFRVTEVRLPADPPFKLREPLLGRNIWSLDLPSVAADLRDQQPWLKEVRVVRRLPNVVEVQTQIRQPVAQVKLEKWYPVDADGVFLPVPVSDTDLTLPKFFGVRNSKTSAKPGIPSADEALQLALRVMRSVQSSSALASRHLEAVDVSDPMGIRLMLDGETEVRCGAEEELASHLDRLKTALKTVDHEEMSVRYIDVRFQDPVVAPRT